jgi:hypothetical protein
MQQNEREAHEKMQCDAEIKQNCLLEQREHNALIIQWAKEYLLSTVTGKHCQAHTGSGTISNNSLLSTRA